MTTRCYICMANMKVSNFHNLKFIANAVTMGLYNKSAMVVILDMQISWFSNSMRAIHRRVLRKKYWRLARIPFNSSNYIGIFRTWGSHCSQWVASWRNQCAYAEFQRSLINWFTPSVWDCFSSSLILHMWYYSAYFRCATAIWADVSRCILG